MQHACECTGISRVVDAMACRPTDRSTADRIISRSRAYCITNSANAKQALDVGELRIGLLGRI